MSKVTIDNEMALNRLGAAAPEHLLSLEDAYYLLYGEPFPKSVLLKAWELFDAAVFEHVKCVYYLALIKIQDFFSNDASVDYIDVEDAPPGTKKGDVLFVASDIELYLRRARREMYHPSLGINMVAYDFGDGEIRIDPSDLDHYLRGEASVESWTPASNPLNAQAGVKSQM